MNLQQLSANEKILLAEQLWESARLEASGYGISEPQKAELDYRLAAYELDKDVGDSWEAVKKRLLST